MAQFNTPLGDWNYGVHGASEHNPGFDSLFHRVLALDSNWENTVNATMVNKPAGISITKNTLQETLRYILSMYEEAE